MARALDDVCVVIPIREYGITNSHGLEQIVQSNDEKDCVSYRVLAPKLLVSFSWNTSDDFDLSVKEPGLHGFEMSRFDKRAPSGGHLINDNNSGFCGLALAGREQVVYQQDAELTNGTYSVSVRHFKNCRRGASAWKLDVTLASGTRLLTLLGVSNEKQSLKPIFNVAFTV